MLGSPKAAQALGCSLTPGLQISFGWVTCITRAASAPRLGTLGFPLLRGACVWVWVVVGFGCRLHPANPGSGVRVCVCLFACSACTPPHLAGVCGVAVCAWARFLAAPRNSWLGCRGSCLLVCALRLRPAIPGWGVRRGCVCLGSGFSCAPRLLAEVLGCGCLCACSPCTPPLLAGVCGVGVCAWVRVSAAPRHSWLGCRGVSVLRFYPAIPGSCLRCGCVGFCCAPPLLAGVLGCACLCACSPCTPPLLAGVCSVGVCAWARVSVGPRHSLLGYWAVCVLMCALALYPRVCVSRLGLRLRPATPGWCVGVCVFVCVLPLFPATPGWGVECGCVCLGSVFGCAPPFLARVLGCVCAGVRAPLVLRETSLGCAAWVCLFGLGFRLRPATPRRAVVVCVFVCVIPL